MKKRKTYEISVIDKTYSKTISDETKFYTSDTALELVFKLKETEYTFDSAEIVLSNIDDRSLVTRQVTKVNNDFMYELDDDIIPHYGEWHGQLRFEAGEIYVSSPVKFRIENDLGNDRPPQLSDVQSWVSLKRYADKLTDELKQAVLEVEGMDDTFKANELARQSTFEVNESERNQTFESNELTRQTQELEREKAEVNRQTTFENNETNRTETFNANETTRQTNETTRQQAESERKSAELARVESEEERILNYENMQGAIDSIGKVKLVSAFENSDFSKGTTNWMTAPGYLNRLEVVDGVARNIEVSTENHRSFIYTNSKIPSGHVTYHAFRYKQTGVVSSRIGVLYGLSGANLQQYYYPTGEDFKIYTGMGVSTGDSITRIITPNIVSNGEYSIYLDYLLLLDLTSIFGAGNEPSKSTMDWIINSNGYFDELSIKRDDIQQYELNQLRKAVIALGGTI